MEPEGVFRDHHSDPRIQARSAERLRNAHLAGAGAGHRRDAHPRGTLGSMSTLRSSLTARARLLGAALVLVLAAGACGAADPSAGSPAPGASGGTAAPGTPLPSGSGTAASPTPSGRPPSPSPSSPGDALACGGDSPAGSPSPGATGSPAPDAHAERYEEIEAQVEQLRGLSAGSEVARGVLDQDELCAYLRTSFRQDNPASLVAATEALLRELLLIPGDASLEALYLELLTSQVAGLYDDEAKRMFVVSASGEIGPVEEITYAHEYVHALQDQAFGLRGFVGEEIDRGDRTLARTAVVEGDAVLVMTLWAQQHLSPAELAQVGAGADPASEAVMARMPTILRETLLFPYTTGLQVAVGAWSSGGFAAVDALYDRPPESTEQVLHPAKLASREAPVPVSLPADLATALGEGWRVSLQDTLGEFQLEILLREAGARASADAAAGWGGDRVALLEGPGGEQAVVLDTAWDTSAEASAFEEALRALVVKLEASGRSAEALRAAPDRVVLVSAGSEATRRGVIGALGVGR